MALVKRWDDFDEDVILYVGDISREGYERVTSVCQRQRLSSTAYLVLVTSGGDPHAGYRIARCLRHHYGDFKLLVPDICKSAGTLIAMGAGEIIIADRGELGPLDIQMSKQDELMERSSGLDIQQGLELLRKQTYAAFEEFMFSTQTRTRVSTKMAAEIAAKLAGTAFQSIYAQVDPVRLGEISRANAIGFEYGRRLDEDSRNLKHGALVGLITRYPSHSFVIDRKEACNLFERVRAPDERESGLVAMLYNLVRDLPDLLVFNWNSQDIEVTENDATEAAQPSDAELQAPHGACRRDAPGDQELAGSLPDA
ncbi:SDH family Clp fold serine proteinase [Pseudomonas phenolilytica]|uniref:SDH family Clp fold serine proteinase n=1 Tax=Pseudomonas phenolilytica TaxID=2746321 RepID=UPI001F42968A|nr:hypothetical protein [Pseudomonas phenolilytica]UIP88450.1 SppA protein [Pseudomonas phenolilytica]